MTDLLEGLLDGAGEGDTVVGNGDTSGGWHVYESGRGGWWVADELQRPQVDHTLHIRTAPKWPTWHRSFFTTHFARPTVHCSWRVDSSDPTRQSLGFKMQYLHQGNNTSFYVMLMLDGRAGIYAESRDGVVGKGTSGRWLAHAGWTHMAGVRRHLKVSQGHAGTMRVWLDGSLLLEAQTGYQSGQIGFRLDGLDARIFSLVVEDGDDMSGLSGLPQQSPEQWGARRSYDDRAATAKDGVTVHYVGADPVRDRLQGDHSRCVNYVRNVESFHIDGRGWSGIAYNYVVCGHGTLFRGRGEARGAHNPADSDADGTPDNVDAYGVLLLVGGDDRPTVDALQMLRRVCDAVDGWVAPHSKVRATACPGDALRRWVSDYNTGTVPEEDDKMAVADWAKAAWAWGKSIGLVKDQTVPGDTLTKQELIVLLKRYHDSQN